MVSKDRREEIEKKLTEYIVKIADKENATPEELDTLARVAAILLNF